VDFAGPEVLTLREMAEQLTAAREVDRRIHETTKPANSSESAHCHRTSRGASAKGG